MGHMSCLRGWGLRRYESKMDSALRVAVDERLIIRLPHRTLLFVLFVIVVVDSLMESIDESMYSIVPVVEKRWRLFLGI